jgi:hypothetical protein
MDQEFIKHPSQLEPDLYQVQVTEPLPYYEIEPVDGEDEFNLDELDTDFESGP